MITVVGLGPGSYARIPSSIRDLLEDESTPVVLRTLQHPAASELASMREVLSCDDLYDTLGSFEEVYDAIVDRLTKFEGGVIYAVPGSPLVGEFAVRSLSAAEVETEIIAGESFVDAVLGEVGYDPLDRGLQILNGHALPDPLILDKPTIIAHLTSAEALGDAALAVGKVTSESQEVSLAVGLGSDGGRLVTSAVAEVDPDLAGDHTSMFIDAEPGGLIGAVKVMRRLREECLWDREQTHHSLVKNLVEEMYELVEAISRLDPENAATYASVEDELGDVLLQVLFQSAIAREASAFDIDDVAGSLVAKLVRRHPHVFGDLEVSSPEEVKRNWDAIKASESPDGPDSALSGVPEGMPAIHRSGKIQNRAAKVGFDWSQPDEVVPKVTEELEELVAAMAGDGDVEAELGDLLFSIVNLSRHLGVDGEIALRKATSRFEERFLVMESDGPLKGLTLAELDERWERAKASEEAGR